MQIGFRALQTSLGPLETLRALQSRFEAAGSKPNGIGSAMTKYDTLKKKIKELQAFVH